MAGFFGLEPSGKEWSALKVGVFFGLAGCVWVLFSDQLLLLLVDDVVLLTRLQMLKGWAFVLVGSVLLTFMVRHYLRVARRQDERMRLVAQGVSVAAGDALFHSLTRSLALAARVDCVFLCELSGPGNQSMRSLSAYGDGNELPSFECQWADTPCAEVLQQRRLCIYPQGVRQRFSHPMLEQFEAEAFIGTPLIDSAGHTLGVMGLLNRNAFARPEELGDLLLLFTTRAAVELERKRTSEALRISENHYRTVFEHNGAALLISEADTTISMANREFARLCGESLERIQGRMSWAEFVAQDDRERLLAYHRQRRIDSDSAPRNYEFCFVGRDGQRRIMFVTVAMIPETSRSVIALWDITERKRAEEETQCLAAIVESFDQAIIGKTTDGTIFSWNRAAEQLYGYSAAEAKGRHISLIVPPTHAEELHGILEQIRHEQKIDQLETVRRHKDGRLLRVRLAVTPIWDCSSRLIGVTTISQPMAEGAVEAPVDNP